jgi:hypothetical protein
MAPERFEGWSDRRSDIYGLGMTLYELLTLRPAFEAATRARLIEQVIHDPPAAPRKCDTRIPRDLETIVLKAIAKEPGERYATAETLAADLENHLADRPIVARRSSSPERAWRWCRRNPAAAGMLAASAVAALALVGVIVGSIDNTRVRESRREAVEAKKLAEVAAENERRLDYFHRIALAEREWQGNNPRRAEQLLDECPNALRGWEWNYLKQVCHSDSSAITGHYGQVFGVAFSPDGRKIASAGSQDQSVRVSDANTLQLLRSFDGLDGWPISVTFSPDGRRLAAGLASPLEKRPSSIRIWDLETGKEDRTLPGHVGFIWCVAFSPDGMRIASACDDRMVRIWDAKTGELIKPLEGPAQGFTSVAFSPRDGRFLASATGTRDGFALDKRGGEVTIWNTTTWRRSHVLRSHTGSVNSVA